MARIQDRHPAGAPGPWFVDTRCIDCDAARHVAPGLVERNPGDGVSYFVRQSETPDEIEMAWRAVEVCPTRSVGHVELRRPEQPVFPHDLGDGVHRLGHNARSSFGAHSYLVVRDGANLMVDAPRWTRQLVGPVTELGGIDVVLLIHRDDVRSATSWSRCPPTSVTTRSSSLRASYGEAAALELHRTDEDLPPVYSGHNSYAEFGQPSDDDATVVAVRYPADRLAEFFEDCRRVATVETPHDTPNEIRGTPIHVCRGLRGTWDEIWPQLRHLG